MRRRPYSIFGRSASRAVAALLIGIVTVGQGAAGQQAYRQSTPFPQAAATYTQSAPDSAPNLGGAEGSQTPIRRRGNPRAGMPLGWSGAHLEAHALRPLDEPEPYSPEEFPQFALSLRRFQIVSIGVFPFALLFSALGYELGRFGYYSARAGELDGRYAPRLFGLGAATETEPLSNRERVGIIVTAASLSLVIGVVDYMLGRRERAGDTR